MTKKFKTYAFALAVGCAVACSQNGAEEAPIPSVVYTVNGQDFEMVPLDGGVFMMGCTKEQRDDCDELEKPAHADTLSSFLIGKYEVTQKLWKAVMGEDKNQAYNLDCDECPVERVSWIDAQQFITRLNVFTGKSFRLPSEAEWEYAARGGARSKGYKYSGGNNVDDIAWYIENYKESKHGIQGTTHPVGTKKPNELGLYDMSGNVWEWCNDPYEKEYEHNGKKLHAGWPYPGHKAIFRKVLRGGSWGGTSEGCRVSRLDFDTAQYSDEYGGFRLAMDSDTVQIVATANNIK